MPGIDASLLEAISVPGAQGAALVDWTCGFALHSAGEPPRGGDETAAAETAELARLVLESGVFALGDPGAVPGAGATPGAGAIPGSGGMTGSGGIADSVGIAVQHPLPVEDLIVTTRDGYHLIRFVETTADNGAFLHLWLDRGSGNLALARHRLQELTRRMVLR